MKYLKKFNESFGRTFEVPSEFEMAIQELGPNPDADTIISICNELFEETPERRRGNRHERGPVYAGASLLGRNRGRAV